SLDSEPCDLLLLVGGTGRGRTDRTVAALAARQALIATDIALRPGRTAAIGRIAGTPVVAVPGAHDHAFSAFLALVQPVLDRLTGRLPRNGMVMPLARKVASSVGMSEIVLVHRDDQSWMPLAVGAFSLDQ